MVSDSYIAGFFDGEGCINLTSRGKTGQSCLRLYITNTNEKILEIIRLRFGGSIAKSQHRPNWKPAYLLAMTGRIAEKFLFKIGPLLQVKRAQFRLAMSFVDFSHHPSRLIRQGSRTLRTSECLQKEREYRNKMKILNKKGIYYAS